MHVNKSINQFFLFSLSLNPRSKRPQTAGGASPEVRAPAVLLSDGRRPQILLWLCVEAFIIEARRTNQPFLK